MLFKVMAYPIWIHKISGIVKKHENTSRKKQKQRLHILVGVFTVIPTVFITVLHGIWWYIQ